MADQPDTDHPDTGHLNTGHLKIGYDLDGFGYNFVDDAADIAVEHFGIRRSVTNKRSQWDFFETWGIDQSEFWEAAEHYTTSGRMWLRPPVEGWVESIRALHILGHSVHVATARPTFSANATADWLLRYRCGVDSLHLTTDKSDIPFDVLVDDYPVNLDRVRSVRPDTLTILWDQPWNRDDRVHLRLSKWTELVETIAGLGHIPTLTPRSSRSGGQGTRKLDEDLISKAS